MTMLVNCPKCGFSQPKDQYCANCGIDMALFRPRSTPFLKKVLGSPVLHVIVIFGIVLTSILMIRQRQKEELRARVEYLKGGPVLIDRQQKTQVEVSASQQAQAEIAREVPPPTVTTLPATPEANAVVAAAATVPVSAGTLAAAEPTKAVAASDKSVKSADVKTAPNRAVILYAEVDRSVLDQWMEEMRTSGQIRAFDNVVMGVLSPQTAQKVKSTRGVKILQQMEQVLQSTNPNYEWFVGTHKGHEPENEMGFFQSMSLSEWKEGIVKGEIEVQRAFRDPATSTVERVSFGGPFELSPGSAYVMRGLLPSKFLPNQPADHNGDPFLSIFNSLSAVKGQTEFTLILEFDTSGPQGR